jgi:hypothetical protein
MEEGSRLELPSFYGALVFRTSCGSIPPYPPMRI